MTHKELEIWWSYWTPEDHEFDERDTNGGRYRPLSDSEPVVEEEPYESFAASQGANLDAPFEGEEKDA